MSEVSATNPLGSEPQRPGQPAEAVSVLPSGLTEAQRDELLAQVYDQLRSIAGARLAREAPGHTMQATELVHEAYMKMRAHPAMASADRGRFFHAAAEAMRRILIDHARGKRRQKRGAGVKR